MPAADKVAERRKLDAWFWAALAASALLTALIAVLGPREIVVPVEFDVAAALPLVATAAVPVTSRPAWSFEHESARRTLLRLLRRRRHPLQPCRRHPLQSCRRRPVHRSRPWPGSPRLRARAREQRIGASCCDHN